MSFPKETVHEWPNSPCKNVRSIMKTSRPKDLHHFPFPLNPPSDPCRSHRPRLWSGSLSINRAALLRPLLCVQIFGPCLRQFSALTISSSAPLSPSQISMMPRFLFSYGFYSPTNGGRHFDAFAAEREGRRFRGAIKTAFRCFVYDRMLNLFTEMIVQLICM